MPRYDHAMNVMITKEQHETLVKMSENTGSSIAHVFRTALQAYISHQLWGRPTCANGQPCPFQTPQFQQRGIQPPAAPALA